MRKWLILLSVLSMPIASATPAWTWVDKEGTTHFSDRPVPGAKQIELRDALGLGRPAVAQPAPSSAAAQGPAPAQPAGQYRTFTVTSPAKQQTLWNIGGNLPVQVDLQPGLQSGHHLDVFLDGKQLNLNETSSQFTVPNVYRGLHTLQAAVYDSSGKEILRSQATEFMVQQTSILNPNNPNAAKAQTAARPGGK